MNVFFEITDCAVEELKEIQFELAGQIVTDQIIDYRV